VRPRQLVLRVAVFLVFGISTAVGAELHALTSAALTESYNELAPEFEHNIQSKVTTGFGGDDLPKRIANGEPADLVIVWRVHLDQLVRDGFVVKGSEVDVVHSKIGVAVRAGSPKPDISSVDALRRTLLNARSIAYSATLLS